MSKAAFTVKAFGVCLPVLGLMLVVASNVLLGLFGIPATVAWKKGFASDYLRAGVPVVFLVSAVWAA